MSAVGIEAVTMAAAAGDLLISPVSAWEIGLLAERGQTGREFEPDAATWFATLLAKPGVRPAPFDSSIALASTSLPQWQHRDPADRFLVATAKALDAALLTRDDRILAYAAAGHVRAIAC